MEDAARDRETTELLRIEGVSKRFGGFHALRSVTMHVRPGTVCGLIGPNGSGKSTLFNVVTGVLPMDSGAVYIGRRRVDTRRPDLVAVQGIGRTFQIPKVAREMTVLENLLFGPTHQSGEELVRLFNPLGQSKLRREETDRLQLAADTLALLDLGQVANEYAGTLSGGQLKLLSLGMTLMANPKVLLLDEPVAGVHPVLVRRIVDVLFKLRERGHTLIVIEHNMRVIADICDVVFVLDVGQVIACGSADEVSRLPAVIEAYLGTGEHGRGNAAAD